MTIIISTTRAASLSASGESNNPFVAYANVASGGTITTSIGAEVQSALFGATGTTYDAWSVTLDTDQAAWQVVFASSTSLSFAAMSGHNLPDISGSVSIEYSLDGGTSWTDSGAGVHTPSDRQSVGLYFTSVSATHWRFLFSGTGSEGNLTASVLFLGNVTTIPQRIYQGYSPPITPNVVDLQSNVSEGGNLLGSAIVRKGSTVQASLTDISPTFIRSSEWMEFQRQFNSGAGLFWAWRPTKYGDLYYAWREGSPLAPNNSGPTELMSFDIGMRFFDDG